MSDVLLPRLIAELPELGGWPEWAHECVLHTGSQKVMFYDEDGRFSHQPKFPQIEFDKESDVAVSVSREAYEAALAASKPEWDGEYPIPAGTEVEVHFDGDDSRVWTRFRVEYMAGEVVVLHDYRIDNVDAYKHKTLSFRTIRSEADKKKEAVEKAIADALLKDGDFDYAEALRLSTFVYGAISRNEIPHIRID